MSVLVVVDTSYETEELLDHVGRSLVPSVEVHVITVAAATTLDDVDRPHSSMIEPNEVLVRRARARLRKRYGFRRVKASVQYGAFDEAVLSVADRYGVSRIILNAPVRRGLLTAFGVDSHCKRLCSASNIPIELFRPVRRVTQADQDRRDGQRVVLPLSRSQLPLLHAGVFQQLTLGSRLTLSVVGVISPSIGMAMTEASPANFLKQLHSENAVRELLPSELREQVESLTKEARLDLEVYYDVMECEYHAAIARLAHDPSTDLLLLPLSSDRGALAQRGFLSPAATLMSVPCSIMLMNLLGSRTQQQVAKTTWECDLQRPADNVVPFPL